LYRCSTGVCLGRRKFFGVSWQWNINSRAEAFSACCVVVVSDDFIVKKGWSVGKVGINGCWIVSKVVDSSVDGIVCVDVDLGLVGNNVFMNGVVGNNVLLYLVVLLVGYVKSAVITGIFFLDVLLGLLLLVVLVGLVNMGNVGSTDSLPSIDTSAQL